jgi:CHAT domain-containing protein
MPGTPDASFASVVEALPEHRWTHFSCHGVSELEDPSASALLLADHQSRRLTVLDLMQARLDEAELAFLSACTTARTGATLPDESIHLATACQLAGYRHVIATLWPVEEDDAARVTKRFYLTLHDEPADDALAAGGAAAALHAASRRLYAVFATQPSRWAAFTHAGP